MKDLKNDFWGIILLEEAQNEGLGKEEEDQV